MGLTYTAPDIDEDEGHEHHLPYHRQPRIITVTAENNDADQEKAPTLYLEIFDITLLTIT